jgi:hypothetical protein
MWVTHVDMFKESEELSGRKKSPRGVVNHLQVKKIPSFLRGDQTRYKNLWNCFALNDDSSEV